MSEMITVRELIAELIKHDMDTEVCLSIDEPHQSEHGKIQGYVFDIDSIEYTYGALMIKFKDYRSELKEPVIHCKDCKYYKAPDKYGYSRSNLYCCRSALMKMSENDFCSKGERKEVSKYEKPNKLKNFGNW